MKTLVESLRAVAEAERACYEIERLIGRYEQLKKANRPSGTDLELKPVFLYNFFFL